MKYSPIVALVLVQAAAASSAVVATVSSSQPFSIGAAQVPVTGVSNWPVFSGDQVSTTAASAVVSFRDGSRVVLEKNTSIVFVARPGDVGLKVLKGKVLYKLSGVANYVIGSAQQSLGKPPSAQGSAAAMATGNLVFSSDSGILSTIETYVRHDTSANTSYPISITYNALPPGVTSVPGPVPTSVVTPAH